MSMLKAATELNSPRFNGKGKAKASVVDLADGDGDSAKTKPRRDKVLLICSRGVTQRMRHLMRDLEVLLPHTKKGTCRS